MDLCSAPANRAHRPPAPPGHHDIDNTGPSARTKAHGEQAEKARCNVRNAIHATLSFVAWPRVSPRKQRQGVGGCRRPVAVSSEEFRDAFPSPDSSSASDSDVDAVPASTASDAPAPAVVSQSLHNQPGNGASVGEPKVKVEPGLSGDRCQQH